jgi:dTMP kinase
MAGKLIVFEGAEGAGKTTQIGLLRDSLRSASVPAITFREPGGTPLGDAIRKLVLDPARTITPGAEAHLFMGARAELCEREIRPALARGLVVLLDRFFLSTYAYQVVGRGLPEEEVRAANRLATGGLVPDLTVLLDHPVSSGLDRADARGGRDRIERSADGFHGQVAAAFRRFAERGWLATHPEAGPIELVDATGAREEVARRVLELLARRVGEPFASLNLGTVATGAR